jgi:hypothetical protein
MLVLLYAIMLMAMDDWHYGQIADIHCALRRGMLCGIKTTFAKASNPLKL